MDIELFGKTFGLILRAGWAPPLFSWEDGHYWGWHHYICLGPFIIFWGPMTEAEIIADAERHGAETPSA